MNNTAAYAINKAPLRISAQLDGLDLSGKRYVVTGGSSGAGEATVKFLAQRGAQVITSGRNLERGKKNFESCPSDVQSRIVLEYCDLADMLSVEEFASKVKARWDRMDGLVNNAGGVYTHNDPKRHLHVGGEVYDAMFVGNHVGPFHLTNLLLPLLEANAGGGARVVNVSSFMHDNYDGSGATCKRSRINFADLHGRKEPMKSMADGMKFYGQSKLANVLHANELHERYASKGIFACSLHPGFIDSQFARGFPAMLKSVLWLLAKVLKCMGSRMSPMSPADGAQTSLHCLLSEDALRHNGGYFSQYAMIGYSAGEAEGWPLGSANPEANNAEIAKRLWEVSAQTVVKLKAAKAQK